MKKGDFLTPEVSFRGRKIPFSNFHRAISVGKWGDCCGVFIHGLGSTYGGLRKLQRWKDWTKGCIALTNDEIEEIYQAVDSKVKIKIYP